MNATEARISAQKINEDRINASYKSAKEQIEYAASQGKFEITFYDDLPEGTSKRLELEGFKVQNVNTGINEYGWEITW
jgi:hypothetical protein